MAEKQPKQRNEAERKARFEKHFTRLDKDGSGELNYEEFKKFLIAYNKKEMPEKQYKFYFAGSDLDGQGTIDRDELFTLTEALVKNDKLEINKLFFRAVDKDRSNEIDAEEFVEMADLNGVKMTEQQAADQISKLTGGRKVLTFAEMHKILAKEDIDPKYDPYDGTNTKKDKKSKKDNKTNAAAAGAAAGGAAAGGAAAAAASSSSDDQQSKSGGFGLWSMIMMVLSCLAFCGLVICAAAQINTYAEFDDELELSTLELHTGVKPKDALATEKGQYNLMWALYNSGLILGIPVLVLAILELLIFIALLMEMMGKRIPIIKGISYGPVFRGVIEVFVGVGSLGYTQSVGIAGGIITAIIGFAIIVVGVLEKFLGGPAKAK